MTGKEELPYKITYSKEAKEMIEKENLGRIIEDDFVAKVCESIYLQQIDELTQCKRTLTKYKRAFEILKDNFFIDLIERQDDWKLGFEPVNPIEGQPRFSQLLKEEAELLKELMGNEEDK